MNAVVAFFIALVFGFGLALARLTDPTKIQDFLDFTGSWYGGPLIVLGVGVCLYAAAFRLLRKRRRPLLAPAWSLPLRNDIDARLVIGSLIFGIGWGLGGYCPGPAVTSIAYGKIGTIVFVVAMLLGAAIEPVIGRITLKRSRPPSALEPAEDG